MDRVKTSARLKQLMSERNLKRRISTCFKLSAI